MKKHEIHLADWQRILFGQAPPLFLLEVLLRTLIIYFFLILVLRWLGKRMSGQLTILEMAVMLTLGAIVSVAMQTPDRGIALSMFVLICTLMFQHGISRWEMNNASVEEVSQGRITVLVQDGVMNLREMRRCRISRPQLLAELRGKGVLNLGEISRVYLEACGIFTTIKAHHPVAGLPTTPPADNQVLCLLHQSDYVACINCGHAVVVQSGQYACPRCGASQWTAAVTS